MPTERLSDLVHVSRRFQRSIRIDTDLAAPHALEGYVCPASAAAVLEDMARNVTSVGHCAFTWTGPYGAGKSSLAVVLAAAISKSKPLRDSAAVGLPELTLRALQSAFPTARTGWATLAVMGRRADLRQLIMESIEQSGLMRFDGRRRWDDAAVCDAVVRLAQDGARRRGLVVIVDELGKLVEHSVLKHGDLHLLQLLAEAANRSDGRLVVIGILHQAFAEYAHRSTSDARDELTKIHGRFIDYALGGNPEEQVALIGKALGTRDRPPKRFIELAEKTAKECAKSRTLNQAGLKTALEGCWPISPAAVLLLGALSRRRFAQNQRSVFGFLTGAEPFGFQEFLLESRAEDLYSVPRLWAYLRTNLEASILASTDGHRWTVAVDAHERVRARADLRHASDLVATIALLDFLRDGTGLSASARTLELCLPASRATVSEVLASLVREGVIVYRRHLDHYAIASGSDFDLEEAMAQECASTGVISAQEIARHVMLRPVLAKRFHQETGALYWAPFVFCDSSQVEQFASQTHPGIGLLAVVVPNGEDDKTLARMVKGAAGAARGHIAFAVSSTFTRLYDTVRDLVAVQQIALTRGELRGDSIARKEVDARIRLLRDRVAEQTQEALDDATWYLGDSTARTLPARRLTELVSDMASRVYPSAPKWPNELLNRAQPSASANAGLRILLHAMAMRQGDAHLGLEGYGAERGLFESLIARAGLYRNVDSSLVIAPPPASDPCGLLPAWRAADALLTEAGGKVSLDRLYEVWSGPPFGIKPGLLPLLAFAFALASRERIAWYRDGLFQTRITDVDADVLLQGAHNIELRIVGQEGESLGHFLKLADVVRGSAQVPLSQLRTPLAIARALVAEYDRLPGLAQRTQRLSPRAIRLRNVLKLANDPNRLLLEDIPSALEERLGTSELYAALEEVLHELRAYYGQVIRSFAELLAAETQGEADDDGWMSLRARARAVADVSGDLRVRAFVGRLAEFDGSQDAVEGLCGLAANKPVNEWRDPDEQEARIELADLCQRFLRSELFARVRGRPAGRRAIGILLGKEDGISVHHAELEVGASDDAAVQAVVRKIHATLGIRRGMPREVVLAALAEIASKLMQDQEVLQ